MSRLPLVLLLALLGCAPAQSTDTSADDQAIRGRVEAENSALASQNESTIASIYAADARMLPPNMPRLTGRDSIRKFFAMIWPMKASLSFATVTLHVSGDWAIEEGNYTWTMPSPAAGAPPIDDHGKYLATWRRAGTTWEIAQDIWNSDLPVPAPATAAPSKPARR
jgi:ketosteroid isomerase-like protein